MTEVGRRKQIKNLKKHVYNKFKMTKRSSTDSRLHKQQENMILTFDKEGIISK